jgi:hypothetical protein
MRAAQDNPQPFPFLVDHDLIDRVQLLLKSSKETIAKTRRLIRVSEDLLEEYRKAKRSKNERS